MSTATATTKAAAADVHVGLLAQGFQPGRPPQLAHEQYQFDRDVYAATLCPSCGHDGMEFLAYHRGPAYAGMARCEGCGYGQEA